MPTLRIEAIVETNFGDTAVVVGSIAQLGAWQPDKGWRLSTEASSYPTWEATIPLEKNEQIEFKIVIIRASSNVDWEPLAINRMLAAGEGSVQLVLAWGNAEAKLTPIGDVPLTAAHKAASAVAPNEWVPSTPPSDRVLGALHPLRASAPQAPPASPWASPPGTASPRVMRYPLQPLAPAASPAFAVAPRPNSSFSVTTSQGVGAPQPLGGQIRLPLPDRGLFDHARAMALMAPPEVSSAAAPEASAPLGHLDRPPLGSLALDPRAHAAERIVVGGPLEAIMSMDCSWPPSVSSSVASFPNSASQASIGTPITDRSPTPRSPRASHERRSSDEER